MASSLRLYGPAHPAEPAAARAGGAEVDMLPDDPFSVEPAPAQAPPQRRPFATVPLPPRPSPPSRPPRVLVMPIAARARSSPARPATADLPAGRLAAVALTALQDAFPRLPAATTLALLHALLASRLRVQPVGKGARRKCAMVGSEALLRKVLWALVRAEGRAEVVADCRQVLSQLKAAFLAGQTLPSYPR
jgi:hypothetical protein